MRETAMPRMGRSVEPLPSVPGYEAPAGSAAPEAIAKRDAAVALAILLLACVLRLSASVALVDGRWIVGTCGEPFLQQVEPIVSSGNPLRMTVFWYPPVPAYIAGAAVGAWKLAAGAVDVGVGCRLVTAAVSVATVAMVYLLGRFWSVRHGLVAMALYAVTMIAVVVQSNVQVYSTFFVSVALYAMLRADRQVSSTWMLVAGVALGLAVASKYTPLLFIGILFIPFVRRRLARVPRMEAGGLSLGMSSPGALAHAWTTMLAAVAVVCGISLWAGLRFRPVAYDVLRRLYERRPHDNPFEFHRVWIDRFYGAALAGAAIVAVVCVVALVIPWSKRVSPWLWARSVYATNREWIVPVLAFAATLAVTIALPASLNPGDYVRYLVALLKMHATGDYGMFPAGRPAPSYLAAYIPENVGLPLFVAGLAGLVYAAIRRDIRVAMVVAAVLPACMIAELSRVKVNRYVLELMPVWSLVAAVALTDMTRAGHRAVRMTAAALVVAVVTYSAVYSAGWARFVNPGGDVQHQAAEWVNRSVPGGTSLGVESALVVNGSPELLPDRGSLSRYSLVDYADEPEYVLLPEGVYAIVRQYIELTGSGYAYTTADWGLTQPTAKDLAVLSRIVREDGYALVKQFAKRPTILGVDVGSASLTGPTWMLEHNRAAGIRIYRRSASRS
jgi:4-amino-4-deoxy-L-arabinose transferase-like glycosyltransferase